ncbi:2OG-Fe(II) oxygenase [Psychroflexus aestuariivivens]|uniref:2OG-Fe(II) oxygenase n=1 Tax=Psychroflexus aestuariivivens TaxID=1795040 RepID=UPI000FDB9DB7|nr:2OG-Fe(II) oxygenase [Psychroflexus aestuariivivens]
MSANLLTDAIPTTENPLYEQIISDLVSQKFSIVDHFFPSSLILELREKLNFKYQNEDLKKAAIGNRVNEAIIEEIRGDFIRWIDEKNADDTEIKFFQYINQFIEYLNRTCFLGILHREFHYAVYPKGKFYKKHLDTFQNDDRRKLSMVCYLNDDNWSLKNGGELVIYPKDNAEIVINPIPGRLVIFESQILEHEVKPVIFGDRLSITGWLKTR